MWEEGVDVYRSRPRRIEIQNQTEMAISFRQNSHPSLLRLVLIPFLILSTIQVGPKASSINIILLFFLYYICHYFSIIHMQLMDPRNS